MLASLFESLRNRARRHTFVFVAFADEESGMVGSRDFVGSLSKSERESIGAMVNVDSVGVGTTAIWVSRSDKRLLNDVVAVASAIQVTVEGVNVDGVGDTDSHSFKDLKIPVIDFHSLRSNTIHFIHSKEDTIKAVNMPVYCDTFRLISTFLGYIDRQLP